MQKLSQSFEFTHPNNYAFFSQKQNALHSRNQLASLTFDSHQQFKNQLSQEISNLDSSQLAKII